MSACRFYVPARQPEDVIPHLAKGIHHWRPRRSAKELAEAWFSPAASARVDRGRDGIPSRVRSALDRAPEYRHAEIEEGFFERQTDVPGHGRPSQTDLLLVLKTTTGRAVIAVEGKVDEPFGSLVSEWLTGDGQTPSENRQARLAGLCAKLDLPLDRCDGVAYQLIHRTYAAIAEAERIGVRDVLMLVHGFTGAGKPDPKGWADYEKFARTMGFREVSHDSVTEQLRLGENRLRLCWVTADPSPTDPPFTIRDFLRTWGKMLLRMGSDAEREGLSKQLDRLAQLMGLGERWREEPDRLPYAMDSLLRRAVDTYDYRDGILEYAPLAGEAELLKGHDVTVRTTADIMQRAYLGMAEELFLKFRPIAVDREIPRERLRAESIDLAAFERSTDDL